MNTLYLRKETIMEIINGKQCPFKTVAKYRDQEAKDLAALYQAGAKLPDRRNKYIVHNCFMYHVKWLLDISAA